MQLSGGAMDGCENGTRKEDQMTDIQNFKTESQVDSQKPSTEKCSHKGQKDMEHTEEDHDDRPLDDWCRVNGWDGCRCCPTCGGSGQYDDCTPCPDCDDGMIDWP